MNQGTSGSGGWRGDRLVALWLFGLALMVAAMVSIGGITRLTQSGLSIAEWTPLMGWIPPLSEAEWQRLFDLYRQTPEYQKVNTGMTLGGFEAIFWWEYLHRLWGRLIGVAFVVPLTWLVWRGHVRRSLLPSLLAVFALGALQGGIGWWMVASGLVDRPDVSQYRLAVHLGAAFLILAALMWLALDLSGRRREAAVPTGVGRFAALVLGMVSLTVVAGAFVAGLDAGLIYNTFPLMDGHVVPPGYGFMEPWWRDPFENPETAQFHHRVLAMATFVAILAFLVSALRSPLAGYGRVAAHALAALACLQVVLGVLTLLLAVPVWLGALHQAGAVVLFATAVWVTWETRRPVTSAP